MKKVIIIGCPGSGKSTFGRKLAEKTGLPLYHLDMLYWNSDKTRVTREVLISRLRKVMQNSAWIIDGNYAATMEMRMQACDTVFFLDYPKEICIEGALARRGKVRSDMPWVEGDKVDEELISFISNFEVEGRPQVIELLTRYADKNIVVFHTRAEADAYLAEL